MIHEVNEELKRYTKGKAQKWSSNIKNITGIITILKDS